MVRNTSITVSRENDFFINENAKMPPVSEVLSKKNITSQTVYDSERQQRLENSFDQKILIKFYDSLKDDFISFDGVIQSKRIDGLCFIASRPLEVETPVLIKQKIPFDSFSKYGLDEGRHAQVISCEKFVNQNDKIFHRISTKFF